VGEAGARDEERPANGEEFDLLKPALERGSTEASEEVSWSCVRRTSGFGAELWSGGQ
jgi:hypothetical protein